MKFCSQLKLLLWKNWLLRKRRKGRMLVEIFWPLVMISLVVVLHSLGQKDKMPNCHIKGRALPLAGELLFFQSLLCSITNVCDSEYNAALPTYKSSIVSNLDEAIKEAFNLSPEKRRRRDVNKDEVLSPNQMKNFLIIENLIEGIKKSENIKVAKYIRPDKYSCTNDNSFFSGLRRRSAFEPYENLNDTEILSRVKTKIYESGLIKSLSQYLTENEDDEDEKPNSPILSGLDFLMCGPKVAPIIEQIMSLMLTELRGAGYLGREVERQKYASTFDRTYVNDNDNGSDAFCDKFMEELELKYPNRASFRIFKPLVRGKLVYAPDAPVINRMMGRIKTAITGFGNMLNLIKGAATAPSDIDSIDFSNIINKYKNTESVLRKIVKTKTGKQFLKNFGSETEKDEKDDDIERKTKKFQKILDETLKNWEQLQEKSNVNFTDSNLNILLQCIDLDRIIPMKSEEEAVKEAMKWLNQERLWGLIVFPGVSPDANELPPSVTYKIRTGVERSRDTNYLRDQIYVPTVSMSPLSDVKEITGGLVYIMNLIEGEMLRELTGRDTLPGIFLKQMPYPCHVDDQFRRVITRTLPMFMVISWIYMFCMAVKRIVAEKENNFKGTLRIFGVTPTVHWLSWFIDAFVPMAVVTTIVSVLLVLGDITPNSNFLLVWLFLTSFGISTITLAFLVSTFFSQSSFGMAMSGMLYFLLYLPYPAVQNNAEVIDPIFKATTCIVSNVAFGLGCSWLANMEQLGSGGQLHQINYTPVAGDHVTMAFIIGMFILDTIIYLLLAIYLDNVLAANNSVKLPYHYFLLPSYWKNSNSKRLKTPKEFETETAATKPDKNPRYFEPDPEHLKVGIEIINLTKEFGKKKKVVKELNLNFYEGQITSFLGHNGAGKTTTISMMIGLIPITSGTVKVYGVDVKTNPQIAVQNMGICQQADVLLDDLTVEEHFKFFAKLKDRPPEEVEKDSKKLLEDLQLGHRAKKPVKILSGGMKRKVCVAMAFIGGSRTVFLDEPTAGIDPYSRRSIWDLLVKHKKGRTIILTTHFLDEADLLGDRIAIISTGELRCCGSSTFLKSNLGRGYYLTIESTTRTDKVVKRPRKMDKTSMAVTSSQVKGLDQLIRSVVPKAEFSEEIGSEIVFILPPETQANDYNTLFKELDKNKERLNFSSYGVTDTSLEEVFMKILMEEEEKQEKPPENQEKKQGKPPKKSGKKEEPPNSLEKSVPDLKPLESGPHRVLSIHSKQILKEHFVALTVKRFLHHTRNYKILLVQVLMPLIFLAIALALTKTLPSIKENPPLDIDISAYDPSSIFYTNEFPSNARLSSYEQALLGPQGFGTRCNMCPGDCTNESISMGSLVAGGKFEDSKKCNCEKGYFECDEECLKPPPNIKVKLSFVMSNGVRLYNLTGLNLSNWLLSTEYEYSPHRMGGMTFGHFTPFKGMSIAEFMQLFQFIKIYKMLQKVSVNGTVLIDPDLFTAMVMAAACNQPVGQTMFANKDLSDNIIVWFNNRGWIADLALLNGVTNLVLKASLPDGRDPSQYSIRFINHPLPITSKQIDEEIDVQTNIAVLSALSVIWALSFIPAMYAVYLVEETVSGLKHLEIVSGISRIVYWTANLFWDMMFFSISIITIVFLYYCFSMDAFVSASAIGPFIILLYSYGFVNITFAFVISFMFNISSSAFIFIACWNIFGGVATLLTTFTLSVISTEKNPYHLKTVFMIFPQFCFGESLVNMALENLKVQSIKAAGLNPEPDYFAWDLLTKYIIVMLILGVIFFILTILIEYKVMQRLVGDKLERMLYKKKEEMFKRESLKEEDDDVKKERERVESGKAKIDGDLIILNSLSKVYTRGEVPAVDRISVGIKRGECFGLLGLNGAGKTTLFKMLTGQILPTEGDTTISGYSIRKNPKRVKSLVGYCPQIHALDPYLTAKEHLTFFCRIRGFMGDSRKKEVMFNLERLGLIGQENKIVRVLSGGNKRKVNTAIAMICDPQLVLLDEPTSGMDVLSRRFIWNCLQGLVLEGRSVVLTSHSMEECQALCTQLSIMVRGKFKCFGSSQRLKNKFDEGYSVTVRLFSLEKQKEVMAFFSKNLPDSTVVDSHYLQIKFRLSPNIYIGSVFTALSKAKEELLIQDYSISQTTLEAIFLRLAVYEANKSEPSTSKKSNPFRKKFEMLIPKRFRKKSEASTQRKSDVTTPKKSDATIPRKSEAETSRKSDSKKKSS